MTAAAVTGEASQQANWAEHKWAHVVEMLEEARRADDAASAAAYAAESFPSEPSRATAARTKAAADKAFDLAVSACQAWAGGAVSRQAAAVKAARKLAQERQQRQRRQAA